MQTGTLLAQRYRIEAPLGEGGMGLVFRAHDTLLKRAVAIKMLSPHLLGDEGVKRLLREAQAAAALTHPNIVSVYDVIDSGDARMIVMEYVDGRPLAALIPLEATHAIDIVTQVCRALQYAHNRGIVHRDIKPENIVVTADGIAKLMDFGLARSEGRSRMTQSGLIVGTVAYMAPEQVLGGTVDARSDLYSLGCVLYEALTGRKPFGGDDPFTVLSQQVNVRPVAPRWHNSAISPTLDAVVMRLLAKDPGERYASATAVIEALDRATEAATGDAQEAGLAPATTPTRTTLLEHIVRGRLVGRSTELTELREHLDRMLSGEGRLVLISGEPGIGKTRLAEELAVYAHLRGARVLRGHCYEQDVGVPYLPFVECLRQLLQQTGDVLQQLGERASDLARLLPEAGPIRPEGSALNPEDERVRAFEAAAQWVSFASRTHPLVFILDDLHWADQASLRLLHHLARSSRTDRTLLVGTYREMELDTDHPLNDAIGQMNRERLFYRLPLRRLSEADTRALLSGLFDVETSQELAGAIYRETEGNPFFIEEVVRALVEEGKIYREAGRWQRLEIDQLEIPQSVKAAIGRRMHKASNALKRLLTIAAVVGREFDPDILAKISQLDEDAVLDTLDEALRLQLVREVKLGRGIRYAFEHALIRQTLYDGLNARRRARLHQQVGEAMEAIYHARPDEHIEELAYHFGESGLATADKGIKYNMRAAAKAAGLFALDEAARRLSVALELADAQEEPQARLKVLQAMGDLFLTFMERRRAAEAYERALEILRQQGKASSGEAVDLLLKAAEASATFATDISPQAIESARRAVELLAAGGDAPRKARALSLLALHQIRAGDIPAARATAAEAADLATQVADRDALAKAYQAMASVHRSSNEWDRFREFVDKRKTLLAGSALTATDVDLFVDVMQSLTSGTQPNYDEAERVAREFLQTAIKHRSSTAMFQAHHYLRAVLVNRGKWDEGLQHAERAIELGRRLTGVNFLLGWSLAYGAFIHVARGDDEKARNWIAQVETLDYDIPPEHHSPRTVALNFARMLGDRDLLQRLLVRVEAERPRCLTCQFIWTRALGGTFLWLGDMAAAERYLSEAERILPENPDPDIVADLEMFRAGIADARGDSDAAIAAVQSGLQRIATMPLEVFTAVYRQEAAAIYLHRQTPGDLARARELLDESVRWYQAVGATRFIAEIASGPVGRRAR